MHTNSALMFSTHMRPLIAPGARVLEIGPDGSPSSLERLVDDPTIAWTAADLQTSLRSDGSKVGGGRAEAVDLWMPSEYEIPVADDSFDVVVAANVIEHVRKPWRWTPELARVTKPGGYVMVTCPVTWEYHPVPVDCWRMYPEGLRALAEEARLEVVVAVCDSLEVPLTRRPVPGSPGHTRPGPVSGLVRKLLGWPCPLAYDSVCVAQKRPSSP